MSALDVTARAMAATQRRTALRRETLDKLARGIRAGRIPTVMASPPTVGTPAASSAVGGTLWLGASYPALYTFLRATWAVAGGSYPLNNFMRPNATNSPEAGQTNGGTAPMVRFCTDAPDFEILTRGVGSGYYLLADGELVQSGVIANNPGLNPFAWTRITWGDGSATYRKPRAYELAGLADTDFGGLQLPNTAKVWAAPPSDLDLRIVIHGDSYTGGYIGRHLPRVLGHPDTRASGVGATGFVDNHGGASVAFIGRVTTDVIGPAPDVVIELGGANDEGDASETTIKAAVNAWLDAVQAALPQTLIFMTGPMSPGNATANRTAVRNAKRDACAGRRNVFFLDNFTPYEWVTGTGKEGATAGNGNADWVTGTDGTHPTDLGGQYLANRVAQAMLAKISAELG